jgi:hypothetical protein
MNSRRRTNPNICSRQSRPSRRRCESSGERRSGRAEPPRPVAAYNPAHSHAMTLGPGSRLDAYEIVRPLGSGGMGEVWLATEVRLGRKVALKILPADLTRDPARVHRFEQEARAASALSHPNVCTIHALGETAEGQHYIAMEYVEGRTLRARLVGERLSLREALDIAIQNCLSTHGRPWLRHRSPGHPAGERDAPAGRVRKGARLRSRKAHVCGRVRRDGRDPDGVPHRCGHCRGYCRLHVTGAGERAAGGRADGHLVARRDAVRDGRRARPLHGAEQQRRARRDPAERTRAADPLRSGHATRAAANRQQGPAQGSRAAVSNHYRPATGSRGAAERAAGLVGGCRVGRGVRPAIRYDSVANPARIKRGVHSERT